MNKQTVLDEINLRELYEGPIARDARLRFERAWKNTRGRGLRNRGASDAMKERLFELLRKMRECDDGAGGWGPTMEFADEIEAILKEPEIVPHANEPCSWDDPPYCETHGGYAPNGWSGVGKREPCSKINPDVQ